MNKLCVFFVSALIAISGIALVTSDAIGQQPAPNAAPVVTDVCLGCICEAVSGCDRTLKCSDGICGLFAITWAYWADSGKPTLRGEDVSSETAFANCVNDPYCAAESIQGYMNKFGQDCNGDGTVNCLDYAAVHLRGGYGCKSELPPKFTGTLNQCLATAAAGGI